MNYIVFCWLSCSTTKFLPLNRSRWS